MPYHLGMGLKTVEWAGKPNSVSRVSDQTIIYLGRRSPADSSALPAAYECHNMALDETGRLSPPIWACWRWGLPCRSCHQPRGALLPHLFTLTGGSKPAWAVSFLWHYPSGRPGLVLPTTVPCPVRTFLPRRYKTDLGDRLRPLHRTYSTTGEGTSLRAPRVSPPRSRFDNAYLGTVMHSHQDLVPPLGSLTVTLMHS